MADTHVGRIILSLNGLPIAQAKSVRTSDDLASKALKGMSPTGLPIGKVSGTPAYELTLEVYIPKIEVPNWHAIDGAVVTISPRDGIGPLIIYTGCFTTRVEMQTGEEDAATRTITMQALARRELL